MVLYLRLPTDPQSVRSRDSQQPGGRQERGWFFRDQAFMLFPFGRNCVVYAGRSLVRLTGRQLSSRFLPAAVAQAGMRGRSVLCLAGGTDFGEPQARDDQEGEGFVDYRQRFRVAASQCSRRAGLCGPGVRRGDNGLFRGGLVARRLGLHGHADDFLGRLRRSPPDRYDLSSRPDDRHDGARLHRHDRVDRCARPGFYRVSVAQNAGGTACRQRSTGYRIT